MEIKDIQKARLLAVKSGNKSRAMALSMIVSEAQKIAKSDKNREPNSSDVISACQRLVKQTTETLSFVAEAPAREILEAEIQTYSEFLPQQLSETELMTIINNEVLAKGYTGNPIGAVQKYLKENYEGQYNPKSVALIVGNLVG